MAFHPTGQERLSESFSGPSYSNLINAVFSNSDNIRPKRKRCRRKRKSSRKQSRRRVRPGKSRHGCYNLGAPLNNNEFLINQRNWNFEGETANLTGVGSEEEIVQKVDFVCCPPFSENDEHESHAARSPTSAQRSCAIPHNIHCKNDQEWGETSDSDYGSLRSPVIKCTGSVSDLNLEGDVINLEVFDEEFAQRNFEADYTAQLNVLRDELMQLSKRELKERCTLLMGQTKELEQPTITESESMETENLRQELHHLRRENELLREENHRLKLSRSFTYVYKQC